MKIYSLLVHPNQNSLNGQLFNMANDHFRQQGHEVETLDLYKDFGNILSAATSMYDDPVDQTTREYTSQYVYNYTRAIQQGTLNKYSIDQIEKLKSADMLFIQTPILVWSLPAILKFYLEVTFIIGGPVLPIDPWDDDNWQVEKYLTGKKVFISSVMGSGKAMTAEVMGSETALMDPIKSIFNFVGYEWIEPYTTWGTTKTTKAIDEYLTNFNTFLQLNFKGN